MVDLAKKLAKYLTTGQGGAKDLRVPQKLKNNHFAYWI
jgi:hypothetical protein